jgi:hypothetical protein
MDAKKCAALKVELEGQPEPQVVRAERFFDGNDDTGSIGCNLSEHPGITAFQKILTGLESRSDVQAVYTQIPNSIPVKTLGHLPTLYWSPARYLRTI